MKQLTKKFKNNLKDNLKVGMHSRPRCVVEVDRMAFVPGKIDQLTIEDFKLDTKVEIKREWIPVDSDSFSVINTENIVFPVQGMSLSNVTDEFGTSRSGGRTHQGIDVALNYVAYPERKGVGTPILAAWDGKVSKVVKTELYNGKGIHVELVHPGGLKTVYAHLDEALVNVGDTVVAGQMVGAGGNTGNVLSNGTPVLDKFNDPNSMRTRGFGAHLHFEVHELIDSAGNYRAINPRPYLDGSKKISTSISQQGDDIVREEPVVGFENATLLCEKFLVSSWHEKDVYTFKNNFLKLSTLEKSSSDGIYNWNTLTFNRKFYTFLTGGISTGMNIHLQMPREGYMDMIVKSNFSFEQGDLFYIDVNNPNLYSVKMPKFTSKVQNINKVYIPAGDVTINIGIKWGGKDAEINGKKEPKKFSIGMIKIMEVLPVNETIHSIYGSKDFSTKQEDFITAQDGYWQEKELVDFMFTDDSDVFDISVGEFVYMDTVTLEHVESCDIQTSLEQDSAEAIVTLANPEGYYNPEYSPYYFLELLKVSPFSYFTGGFQSGVMSNNTPIRIYMGYGEELVRVFTGLIDKVDITSNPPVLTVTARDMYKKISDKVLTETKQYPTVDIVGNFPGGTPQSDNAFINEVVPGAIETYQQYNILPSITIAQAILESGWGRHRIGNNIFGVKAGDDWTGKTQVKESPEYENGKWVSRSSTFRDYDSVADSIKNHGVIVGTYPRYEPVRSATDYKEAARALQDCGYATDPEYANKLIRLIEENNLVEYDATIQGNMTVANVKEDENTNYVEGFSGSKVAWLKSAVVQDLIEHAGMFGWRRNHEDLNYPNAIIEESYLIAVNQEKGTFVRAVPGEEGKFEVVNLESVPTPKGWMNPYTDEYGRIFHQYQHRVGECISEVLKDTHYRSYCDRYGTFRLETINYNKSVVDTYYFRENLAVVDKTLDFSRARSHIIVVDEEGNKSSFLDKEILIEIKGEIRTASVLVPWAKSYEIKKIVASRLFEDMKRVCRSLQITSPCNPTINLLDRVRVVDKYTSTNAIYTIKGIRRSYNSQSGLVQFLDLYWSEKGTVV